MRKVIILSLGLFVLSLQSCHDNFAIETTTGRSYEQDAVVLNDFVDINKTTHEFFVNPNKRTTVRSYVTNSSLEELNNVTSLNREQFMESLSRVSSQAGQLVSKHAVDYVVMATNGEVYVSKVNRESPVSLNKVVLDSRNKFVTAAMNVYDDAEQHNFYGNHAETVIELNPQFYSSAGWSFYVTCEIGRKQDKETARVLFCGVGHNQNLSFTWQTNPSGGDSTDWNFITTPASGSDISNVGRLMFYQ